MLRSTYTFYILHSTFNILHSTFYSLHSTVAIRHSTFYILYSTQSTVYNHHSTSYILHPTPYILHATCYILHSTLYILHSTFYMIRHCTLYNMRMPRASMQTYFLSDTLQPSGTVVSCIGSHQRDRQGRHHFRQRSEWSHWVKIVFEGAVTHPSFIIRFNMVSKPKSLESSPSRTFSKASLRVCTALRDTATACAPQGARTSPRTSASSARLGWTLCLYKSCKYTNIVHISYTIYIRRYGHMTICQWPPSLYTWIWTHEHMNTCIKQICAHRTIWLYEYTNIRLNIYIYIYICPWTSSTKSWPYGP